MLLSGGLVPPLTSQREMVCGGLPATAAGATPTIDVAPANAAATKDHRRRGPTLILVSSYPLLPS